ncbi:MAG TPA: 2-oxoacid:ferredoxin oxidoreductase subunit beta [Dehalococcoidia bacterium]|nr:2-oxoacid:ferredoxin oxidoreductase subunit beta [Dehalococcoidia bacterium]
MVTRLDPKVFDATTENTWCPGCGDFAILKALKLALADLSIEPHQALLVSGIGCGSKLPDYMSINGYMTIHGRPLPVATGAKLANPDLHVIVVNGDGDSYGIGGNHFVQTCRRNPNIIQVVENNQIYGLTKGQYSPTSDKGFVTTTSPDGAIELAFNPMAVALGAGATFIARAFAGEPKHIAQLIAEGIRHRGYALIDVLQPCVTFNRVNTYDWYRQRVYHLEDESYDATDREAAWAKAHEWEERIPLGILYRVEGLPTYEDQVAALAGGSPVSRLVELARNPRPEQYERLKDEFL